MKTRLLVLGMGWALWIASAAAAPEDLRGDVQTLEELRQAEYERLRAQGRGTPENYRDVDHTIREMAREAEVRRTRALDNLSSRSGVQNLGQAPGGGTDPAQGRGISGDVDTRGMTPREFDRVVRAAESQGYTVKGQGDARTIVELNTTIHRNPPPPYSPPGSSAWQAEAGRGMNPETALSHGSATPDPRTQWVDNMGKGAQHLETPPANMQQGDWQTLGKMTSRNTELGGGGNPQLAEQANLLRQGYSPESAGIVRPNATPAQRLEDLSHFQQQARDANMAAGRSATAASAATEAGLQANLETARSQLSSAQASGDPAAIQTARSAVNAAKGQLTEFTGRQVAAGETLVHNQPNGAQLLNEAAGGPRLVAEPTPEGGVVMRNGQTGETMSPSQVREAAVGTPRAQLAETAVKPAGEPPPEGSVRSTFFRGAGITLLGIQIVQGVMQGAQEAVDAEQPGDSAMTTYGRAVGNSILHASGISHAWTTGTQAGRESMDRYEREKAAGDDPSWAWAKARGTFTGVGRFVKGLTIDPLLLGVEAVKQGGGLVGDAAAVLTSEQRAKKMQDLLNQKKQQAADQAAAQAAAQAAGGGATGGVPPGVQMPPFIPVRIPTGTVSQAGVATNGPAGDTPDGGGDTNTLSGAGGGATNAPGGGWNSGPSDPGGGTGDVSQAGNIQTNAAAGGPTGTQGPGAGSGSNSVAVGGGPIGGDLPGQEQSNRTSHVGRPGDHTGRPQSGMGTGAVPDPGAMLTNATGQVAGAAQAAGQAVDVFTDDPNDNGSKGGGGSTNQPGTAGGGSGKPSSPGSGGGTGKPPSGGGAGGAGGAGGGGGGGGTGGGTNIPPGGGGAGTGGTVVVTGSGTAGGTSGATGSGSGGYAAGPQDQVIDGSAQLAGRVVTGVKVTVSYDAVSIPDQFQIVYGGATLADSGMVSYGGQIVGQAAGSSAQVTIRVISSSDQNTVWNWSASVEYYVR